MCSFLLQSLLCQATRALLLQGWVNGEEEACVSCVVSRSYGSGLQTKKYRVLLLVKHYKMVFARSVSVRRWVADKIEARGVDVDKCRGSLTTCRPQLRGRGPCWKHCDCETCPRQNIRLHIIPLNGPRQQLYTLSSPSSTASYKKRAPYYKVWKHRHPAST
jgi:hypothetical protein